MKQIKLIFLAVFIINCNSEPKKSIEVQNHIDGYKKALNKMESAEDNLYYFDWNTDYTDSIKVEKPILEFIYDDELLKESYNIYKAAIEEFDSLKFQAKKFDSLPLPSSSQSELKFKYHQKMIDIMKRQTKVKSYVESGIWNKNGKMLK
ncbi:hypothetical protein [Aestuariivivens sediminicola]|uniref:hypothetical protein n=1 Tax=Aestuariivivens sediminicola TaxID=2913560 RepID=UPI001F57D0E6|nr:hypothetical protein [Aestuariivivens sediminicola]